MDKKRCIEILSGFIMTGLTSPDKSEEVKEKVEALQFAKKCVEGDEKMIKPKLGKKVKFKKHLRKRKSYEEVMSDEKYKIITENKAKEGYIAGKRTIPFKGYTSSEQGYRYFVPEKYKEIYLVAINLKGFYRVLPEDLEDADNG